MKPIFKLRRFKPEDLNQVISINQICLPENYSSFFFMEIYANFPETFIVAEKDNTIIGYIMCRIEGGIQGLSLRPFKIAKKGHIISIAVIPGQRREGVGYALIEEALCTISTHDKAKECYLEVRVTNTSAINLYKKIGFKVERTISGYYSDGEDAHIMSKKLENEP